MNHGQACVAGMRLFIPRSRWDEAAALVTATVAKLRVGDPKDPATDIGPLFNRTQHERVQGFIRRGIEEGATVIAGGEGQPRGVKKGYFVKPTVFANVNSTMVITREEIFGPVLSILIYDDLDEAVRLANDSIYGLQAYVFSSHAERARLVATRLEVGTVLVNSIRPEIVAPLWRTQTVGRRKRIRRPRHGGFSRGENDRLMWKQKSMAQRHSNLLAALQIRITHCALNVSDADYFETTRRTLTCKSRGG
jgi:acyl-CoA reductase-like NAD-dependent aldehyde dehydrogenase